MLTNSLRSNLNILDSVAKVIKVYGAIVGTPNPFMKGRGSSIFSKLMEIGGLMGGGGGGGGLPYEIEAFLEMMMRHRNLDVFIFPLLTNISYKIIS